MQVLCQLQLGFHWCSTLRILTAPLLFRGSYLFPRARMVTVGRAGAGIRGVFPDSPEHNQSVLGDERGLPNRYAFVLLHRGCGR